MTKTKNDDDAGREFGHDKQGFATRCVHGGEELDAQGGIHAPLYNHSTYGFPNTKDLLDVVEGRREGNLYTRYGMNPTIRAVEKKLANLEGGEKALAFASGMAAEAATFMAYCRTGDHMICIGDVYGGTCELLGENLPRIGIETTFLVGSDVDGLRDHLRHNTRIVFFETPTNPNMEVFDIAAITRFAREAGALTVVDSTFASPVNQRPLELGADLVVHSTTEYLGGHSDLTGGAVIGAADKVDPIWSWSKNLGRMMAPEVAFLLARSLRWVKVRVESQNRNAQAVAEFLQEHPRVKKVNYPGLTGFPGHDLAARQMRGFGGMVTFVFDGDATTTTTAAMVDRLRVFSIAASLGGVESLVTQPITTTHHGMTPEERARRGIPDGMVRLSCGIEDAEDLIGDLRRAMEEV